MVVDSLPVKESHIPSYNYSEISHLSHIGVVDLIDRQVDVLIGTDLASAFVPYATRVGIDGGTLAFYCHLGWVLMGPKLANSPPRFHTA